MFLTLNHPQGRASPAVAIQVALADYRRPPDGTNIPPDILNIPPVWLKVPPAPVCFIFVVIPFLYIDHPVDFVTKLI